MKRSQWLWLACSLATAAGCSDPPPGGNNPPPADVVSEKVPDATDNDVVGQDTAADTAADTTAGTSRALLCRLRRWCLPFLRARV